VTAALAPTPQQLVARGLTRDQARFAAWVLALAAATPGAPLSSARLAEGWSTDRSWVCRALAAISEAGVWTAKRDKPFGREVWIELADAPSLPLKQRTESATRCLRSNETAPIRCPGGNEEPARCLADNEQVLLLLDQRDLSHNNSNRRDNEQPTRQRARAARPSAPSVSAAAEVVSDEERNGGDLGRSAATEPAGQVTSRVQHCEMHVIETLLGGVGLLGRVGKRLAADLVRKATSAKRDPLEVARSAADKAMTNRNPAGWLRRAIEDDWILDATLPGATASLTKAAGAPNQPPRVPLAALPRVSNRVWDVDLERAVVYAIGNKPAWVAHGRTWMLQHGGIDSCFARLREQVQRAPADLEGVFLPGGVAQWRSVVPQLEQFAAKARDLAVRSGAIVESPAPKRRGGVA
jgi:hypothetical protein